MDRRKFIKSSCIACLSFSAFSSIVSGCTPTKYLSGNLGKDGITLPKDAFRINQNGGTAYSSFVIVRNEELKFPICVFRESDLEYKALWMQCSHQGAELQASGDTLQCAAHGSEFGKRGEVISGPADKPLRSFPITIMKEELFIDLRKIS